MRAVVLDRFQGFTGGLVKMPFHVRSWRVCNDLYDLLVQFLKPFIDHDCAVSSGAIACIARMVYSRSDDATIRVAPERRLFLRISEVASFRSSTRIAQSCAAFSVRSTRANIERVFPIPISSARIPPPVSLGSTMAIAFLACFKPRTRHGGTHNVPSSEHDDSCRWCQRYYVKPLAEPVPMDSIFFSGLPKRVLLWYRPVLALDHERESCLLVPESISQGSQSFGIRKGQQHVYRTICVERTIEDQY